MRRYEDSSKHPREFIADQLHPDGTVLDIVRDQKDGLATFVRWNPASNTIDYPKPFTYGSVDYFPIDKPAEWIKLVRLPISAAESADIHSFFPQIKAIFEPLGRDTSLLITAFAVSSWLVTDLERAPRLQISGPEAFDTLRALSLVTRRSALLKAGGSIGTYPPRLRPSLLIFTDDRRFATNFLVPDLRSISMKWRGGNPVDDFCTRVVAIADDCPPTPNCLNIIADQAPLLHGVTPRKLQSQLLEWRLRNLQTLRDSELAIATEDDVLNNLLYGFKQNAEFCSEVAEAYQRHFSETLAPQENTEEEALVEALAHFRALGKPSVYMANIAEHTQRLLAKKGSLVQMSPRHVGDTVRKLGLETRRLSSAGRGIEFTAGNCETISTLTVRHGIQKTTAEQEL
jgi:hypothetical protein